MSLNTSNGKRTLNGRIRPADVFFWILIVLTPLISAGILYLVTGTSTSPLKLDAWNTTWNDEIGYYRVVTLLRGEFYPRGMAGYNEVPPVNLAYGPYNIFTYLPYYALSFITGIGSHNFICYSNVILSVLACLLFVLLVRPDAREGLFCMLFLAAYLIAGRYNWSGMSEGSYNFFLILFTALVLWMMRRPEASPAAQGCALFVMIAIVFFWNVMRPYYFPLLIVPVYMIFRKKSRLTAPFKVLFLLLAAAAAAGSLGLYFYLTKNYVAHYFTETSPSKALFALLSDGSPLRMLKQILRANLDALREIRGYLLNSRWAGVVSILYFAQSLLILALLLRSLFARDKERDGRCAVLFFMLAAGFAIYEANVVLYSPVQLHRMMLAVTLSYGLILAVLGGWERIACQAVLMVLMLFLILRAPENFRLPQVDSRTLSAEKEKALRDDFAMIFPLEEDPWDNTIAKLTESDDLQWEFMLPSYTALNICQLSKMETLLKERSIRSKFVLLEKDSELNALCTANRYPVVWKGYGRILYKTR